MKHLRAVPFVLALLALPACTERPGIGGRARASAPNASATLDGTPMSTCGMFGAALCGRLNVPQDRSDPSLGRIGLRVMVIPSADPDPAPDPVFFLAGGPGGAATEQWGQAAELFPGIHARRDIVLVDQRGTGGSNALRLPPAPDLTGASRRETRAAIGIWMSGELDRSDADPRLYGSPEAADDVDAVRAALGYDRIDLYGGSYGATLAQYYLLRHGDHARAVVLDGGTMLDVPIFEGIAANSQRALDSVLDRCARDAACHGAFPDPRGDLAAAMSRLSSRPERTDVMDPWTHRPIVVDANALATEIHHLLVVSQGAEVPVLIHDAATGRVRPVAERIREASEDPRTSVFGLVMFWSIVCSEGWARFDPARTAQSGTGSSLLRSQLADARSWRLVCGSMPGISREPATAVRSSVPVLLLNGTEDPQDPPSNVAGAARAFPNSLELAVASLGHTIGTRGCLPDVVARFFAAGSIDGLDTSCVASMTSAAFLTP